MILKYTIILLLHFIGQYAFGDTILKRLDNAIKESQSYDNKQLAIIDSLKQINVASQPNINYNIAQHYLSIQADSALLYINKCNTDTACGAITAEKHLWAQAQILMGNYAHVSAFIDTHRGYITDSASLINYYKIMAYQYESLCLYTTNPILNQYYKTRMNGCMDSLWMLLPQTPYIQARRLALHGQIDSAIYIMEPQCALLQAEQRTSGASFHFMAQLYQSKGLYEKAIACLATSALSDIQCGVKRCMSLRELAILMYQHGDINRAYTYLNKSLNDALFCNDRVAAIEIATMIPVINSAYQSQLKSKQLSLIIALIILAITLILLCIALRKIRNKKLILDSVNTSLAKANSDLCTMTQKQEIYLGEFLHLCVNYIRRLEQYQLSLNKKLGLGNIEGLKKELSSTKIIDSELKEFYARFDQAFLTLYPNFIPSFNALLRAEEHITPPSKMELTTELRIFALIRLGITDSEQIAHFLHYSLKTIYNYRTKVRNKASVNRADFEQMVMQIQ
ncbi:MAG: DUF6377 domain-containing protein [Marinifilaceae bacterium]